MSGTKQILLTRKSPATRPPKTTTLSSLVMHIEKGTSLGNLEENALRNAAANRIEQAVAPIASENRDGDFVVAFTRWDQGVMQLEGTSIRSARVSEIVSNVQQLKRIPS